MKALRVVIGVPDEQSTELDYARGLAASLGDLEVGAEILITGTGNRDEAAAFSNHGGVPVHRIPARLSDGLAEYWLEAIRVLEEGAPCLFLCGPSGSADWVYPRLSSRILVVPLLHHDDATTYEYCRQLGGSFDAVIPLNSSLRQRLLADFSDLAPRMATVGAAADDFRSVATACLTVARRLSNGRFSTPYLRKNARIVIPAALSTAGDRARVATAIEFVNRKPRWPDPVTAPAIRTDRPAVRRRMPNSLDDVRIVVGLTSGRISGVDVFSIGLVRELSRQGLRAEVLQTMADSTTSDSLPAPYDVSTSRLQVPELATWPERWASLKDYLGREPTIYLPNYDERHSAIVPTLPSHVRVVGIGHSDDPHYYRHIVRLAPYWDAVVTVSSTIARHLADVVPELEPRMSVVPYGVAVPDEFSGASRQSEAPLLAVYAGRIVQYQKRVFDLLRIAAESEERGLNARFTIAGSGDDGGVFAERAGNAASQRVDQVGSLRNDEILKLLGKCHAFVLPSSFEGLPVSLLEAMANGCVPVVSAIRSGIPELIDHGVNGLLFDIGDTRGATDALVLLGSDEELRQSMARAAYETVKKRYNIEQMTGKYLAIFERLLSAPYQRPIGSLSPPPSIHTLDANMPPFPLRLRKLIAATREMIR